MKQTTRGFRPSHAVARLEAVSMRPPFPRGDDLISLAMGEPDFATPVPIVEAAVDALRAGHTRYVDPYGIPPLRAALASIVSDAAGVTYGPEAVLVTHGGSAGLAAAIAAIVNPGDRVVIPEPTYPLYADLVALAGGSIVHVPLDAAYHLDFDALAPALAGATLLILCSPGNPTGAVISADDWARIARLTAGSSTLVIADEAYSTLVYDGVPFASSLAEPGLRERLIYIQTFSKAYAMTGWRLGYLAGPEPVVQAIRTVHRAFSGTLNDFVQRAALAALRDGAREREAWNARFAERRTIAVDALRAIDGIDVRPPQGGFYAFARFAAPIASTELTAAFLAGGVAVRAGREYGPSGESHFRISFATSPEQLRAGIARIAAVLATLPVPVAAR